MKTYKSLFQVYRGQQNSEVFAFFYYNANGGETFESPFSKLAGKAKSEQWDFVHDKYKIRGQIFPILRNYLNYTFLRLQEQGKIVISKDGEFCAFNTGLLTPNEKDLCAFFQKNNKQGPNTTDWVFKFFDDTYSSHLSKFTETPEPATYITDTRDLVFDVSYQLDPNYDHVLSEENIRRLPGVVQDNPLLARNAIDGSFLSLKSRLLRNYKIAIPHWYGGRIQLLLPLHITDPSTPDNAMVAERDDNLKKYRIRTILTMDMAYLDARIICKPDRDWLNP